MNEQSAPLFSGGCQCGKVRYAIHAPMEMAHYCHCRMCQRAFGNAFGLLAGIQREKLVWTRDEPRMYASSSIALRGFCGECGTPLSFGYRNSLYSYISIGSLDHPELIKPEEHSGIESQLPWLVIVDDLPRHATLDDPRLVSMTVHQHEP